VTFPAGGTITVTGNMILEGTGGNLLLLRSSASGTQWNIDPQGTRSVSYVDVQDSNNINAAQISASNSVDSGNNTGWIFATGGEGQAGGGRTPREDGAGISF